MKIGILTFHWGTNYGGILQAYALQCFLRSSNFDAEIINYAPKTFRDNFLLCFRSRSISSIKKNIFNFLKERKLRRFRNEQLFLSPVRIYDLSDCTWLKNRYQTVIVGSDQVWNPYSKFLRVYGLGFAAEEINTVAYAASIGVSEIPENKKDYLKQNVKSVKHISCREYEGAEALSRLLDRNIPSVLDPTLLLDKDAWAAYASSENKKEKYVLCFFLGSLKYPRRIAMRIAKENRCKLYIIPGSPRDILTLGKIADGCGPREFLNLFLNADFICTDSFHGTAFCLNFNKPFYSFCRRGFDEKTSYLSRIRDLLETVHLQDRLIYPDSKVSFKIENVDFSVANKVLVEERKKSMAFLINALSDGKQK